MFQLTVGVVVILLTLFTCEGEVVWKPNSWNKCRTNEDCKDVDRICCSITPSLGKRATGEYSFPEFVHYCLPYKTKDATWCDLKLQYSPSAQNYLGLCPCGPGLRCEKTTELDPESYPRDRYGKCRPVN